jgi:hypothetical protein
VILLQHKTTTIPGLILFVVDDTDEEFSFNDNFASDGGSLNVDATFERENESIFKVAPIFDVRATGEHIDFETMSFVGVDCAV